jgi:hypothetical protein
MTRSEIAALPLAERLRLEEAHRREIVEPVHAVEKAEIEAGLAAIAIVLLMIYQATGLTNLSGSTLNAM